MRSRDSPAPNPNNVFARSSYALPNIEKLSITQNVTTHCNIFRGTPPAGVLLLQPRGASVPLPEKSAVLVVEENAVIRSANAKRLRAAGFEVLEAANFAEAELILKSTTVDALVVPVRRG
jgi:PleD family two-component response regulator